MLRRPRLLRAAAAVRDRPKVLGAAMVSCVPLLGLLVAPAHAGAWIPAAGTGDVEALFVHDFGDRSFPANSFSSATSPSSKEYANQFRIIGEHGLGDHFSLDYDFRYGSITREKVRYGATVVESSQGFEDQRIGLNYGLDQHMNIADSVGLSIVAPGSSGSTTPRLDSGRWAVEPRYRIGFRPGLWGLTANLDLAARVFVDGGVTQIRTNLEISKPLTSRLKLTGKVFGVSSIRMSGYSDIRDNGQLYDLVRVGADLKFRFTDKVGPILTYESGIYGERGHKLRRIAVGLKLKY